MAQISKNKWANVFTVLVVFFTAFQGMIPAMPISNVSVIAIVSAVSMFLVSALTIWKQYYSDEIDMKALRPTLIVAIIATVTGAADLFKVIDFNHVAGQWIRFGFTAITMFLNLLSKLMYQTEDTKSLI